MAGDGILKQRLLRGPLQTGSLGQVQHWDDAQLTKRAEHRSVVALDLHLAPHLHYTTRGDAKTRRSVLSVAGQKEE